MNRWSGVTDLRRSLRVPIGILVAAVALVRILPAIFCPDRFAHLQELFHPEAMTIGAPTLEIDVLVLGLFLLMVEAFFERIDKRTLAFTAIVGLVAVFAASFFLTPAPADRRDDRLLEFLHRRSARDFLQTLRARDDHSRPRHDDRLRADRARNRSTARPHQSGLGEFFALPIFTCAGLMWMASAIDFVMIFVSLELVTISFYVLVSFTRRNPATLEAGVKYLILSALSTGFLVYGITWIFGVTGETNLARVAAALAQSGDRDRSRAFRHGPGAGRARIQDRGGAVPDLGAGCLSRRADAGDRVSFRRLEGGRIRRPAPRAATVLHAAADANVCSR